MAEENAQSQNTGSPAAVPPPLSSYDTAVSTSPLINKPSGMAKASFIISLICCGTRLFAFVLIFWDLYMGMVDRQAYKDPHSDPQFMLMLMIAGLLFIINFALGLVGLCLGIAALPKRCSNKWMAVTGIIINVVLIGLILFLIVLGHMHPNNSPFNFTPTQETAVRPGIISPHNETGPFHQINVVL
ncbi:MAG TPA: hypothetical protein VKJ65_11705 [Phycisphaerae bacterium]|nr:hypothetical protein [Phycisphaerae bacterium]